MTSEGLAVNNGPLSPEAYRKFLEEAEAAISSHPKTVLEYSGGKDSMACLHLLTPFWDRITVLWVNPGAAYPETLEHMAAIRAMVPNFVEAKGNVEEDIKKHGFPANVIPLWNTWQWRALYKDPIREPLIQDPLACCARNRAQPLHDAEAKLGATLAISGYRKAERCHGPQNGWKDVRGVQYWCPIYSWSEAEVFAFLASREIELPTIYEYVSTSPECRACTSDQDLSPDEVGSWFAFLDKHHPEDAKEARRRLEVTRRAVIDGLAQIDRALS